MMNTLYLLEYWSDGVMHSMFFANAPLLQVPGLVKSLLAGLLNGFQADLSRFLHRFDPPHNFHA
jgi:hypothetical protein